MPSRAFIVFDILLSTIGLLTGQVLMPSRAFIVFDQLKCLVWNTMSRLNALAGIYCF